MSETERLDHSKIITVGKFLTCNVPGALVCSSKAFSKKYLVLEKQWLPLNSWMPVLTYNSDVEQLSLQFVVRN